MQGCKYEEKAKKVFKTNCITTSHETIVHYSARAAHFLCEALCSLWLKPPTLLNSDTPRSESNLAAPKRRGKMPHLPVAKTQISASYSDERPWCQALDTQEVVGYGLILTGFTGLTGLRGGRRNAEGAEDAKRGKSVTNIHVIPSQEPITLD